MWIEFQNDTHAPMTFEWETGSTTLRWGGRKRFQSDEGFGIVIKSQGDQVAGWIIDDPIYPRVLVGSNQLAWEWGDKTHRIIFEDF